MRPQAIRYPVILLDLVRTSDHWRAAALAALVGIAATCSACAETLADAIAAAYQNDPTLQSQRSQLRVVDEDFVQAQAGFRPTLSAQASSTYSRQAQASLFGAAKETSSNSGGLQINLAQPIYTGGRATAGVRAADAAIRAGREQLRVTEAGVLFSAIQAYCDVVRDRRTLVLQRASLKELQDAVEEIRARYEAGANTVTDVSQAEAQLEIAHTIVTTAQAQLELSEAEYVATVGHHPGDLAILPPLPGLPTTLDEAFDVADRESPQVLQAQFAEAQSRAQVQQARAATRPTVTLNSSFGYTGEVSPFAGKNYQQAVSFTAQLAQPIFTGGVNASKIRQALAQDTSARIQVHQVQRSAVQSVSRAWVQRHAAFLNEATYRAEVRAAQAAFEGMRVEYRVGLRATLDVLIAQQTLRDAQVALVASEHDDYLAQAAVLGAVGRLEARVLVRGVEIYRPQVALRAIENVGATPWDAIPKVLDRIGAPSIPSPPSVPQPERARGPIRMVTPGLTSEAVIAVPKS